MYAPVVPSNPDQNEENVFRPKRPKTLSFGAANTLYGLHKGVLSSGPNPFQIVRDRDQV